MFRDSIFVSVALLKPKHDIVFNLYLEHFAQCPVCTRAISKEDPRHGQYESRHKRNQGNRSLLPESLSEQQTIVTKLDQSLSTETRRLESIYQRKLAALEALKKSLLHQAFSGHL